MNNVKLTKAVGKGWFLTIGEDGIKNRWAVTSLELLVLKKMIEGQLKRINAEVDEETI